MSGDRPPFRRWLAHRMAKLTNRLAEGWNKLVGPIERFFGVLVGRSLAATERFERVEGLLFFVVRVLLAPFRFAGRLVGRLLPGSLSMGLAKFADSISYGFYRVGQAIGAVFEFLNLDVLVYWLVWLTWPIWRPIAELLGFAYAWLITRESRLLLFGLPAVVLFAPFAAIALFSITGRDSQAVPRYRLALDDAIEQQDYARIQLLERKLVQLGASSQLRTFNRALTIAGDGDYERAYELMQQLAPPTQPGYAPAHCWIIDQLLARNIGASADESSLGGALIDQHITQLDKLGVENTGLTLVEAMRLVEQQQPAEAAALLRPLAASLPQAAFELLRLDLATQNRAYHRDDAEHVVKHVARMVANDQQLPVVVYPLWATALNLLDRESELTALYEMWIAVDPQNRDARNGQARIMAARAERQLAAHSGSPASLAKLLQEVAELGPPDGWLAAQINRLYDARDRSIIATDIPEQTLASIVDDPDSPAVLLEAVGVVAATRNEWQRAEKCFLAITNRQPDNPIGWNNYAWVLSQQSSANVAKALEAVEHAIVLAPQEFRFRETRGQIFVRLKQWHQAIDDLEFAINGMPESTAVHRSLADAYQAIGNNELAELHHRQADR